MALTAKSLSIATGVRLHEDESDETSPWDVLMSDEATVVIAKHGANVALTPLDVEIEVDPAFNEALEAAWKTELTAAHVSQGAYVSRAQYEEAATSRLSLLGNRRPTTRYGRLDTRTWLMEHLRRRIDSSERVLCSRGRRFQQPVPRRNSPTRSPVGWREHRIPETGRRSKGRVFDRGR